MKQSGGGEPHIPGILHTARLFLMKCKVEAACQVDTVSGYWAYDSCCSANWIKEPTRVNVKVIHVRCFQLLGHKAAADNMDSVSLLADVVNCIPYDERSLAVVHKTREGTEARNAELL